MVDTLALSGAVHSLVIMGVIMLGTGLSLVTQSRTALILTLAVGGSILV